MKIFLKIFCLLMSIKKYQKYLKNVWILKLLNVSNWRSLQSSLKIFSSKIFILVIFYFYGNLKTDTCKWGFLKNGKTDHAKLLMHNACEQPLGTLSKIYVWYSYFRTYQICKNQTEKYQNVTIFDLSWDSYHLHEVNLIWTFELATIPSTLN